MINIKTDILEGTIKWLYNGDDIVINKKGIIYAFEYGDKMVMIKCKSHNGEVYFFLYDIQGKFILSYSLNNGEIVTKVNNSIWLEDLVSVEYSKDYNKIIVLVGKSMQEHKLKILELDGDVVAVITHPKDYYFMSTKYVQDVIMVVCQGITDITKDKYGRNDWNFRIDLNNYYVEKVSITQ